MNGWIRSRDGSCITASVMEVLSMAGKPYPFPPPPPPPPPPPLSPHSQRYYVNLAPVGMALGGKVDSQTKFIQGLGGFRFDLIDSPAPLPFLFCPPLLLLVYAPVANGLEPGLSRFVIFILLFSFICLFSLCSFLPLRKHPAWINK
ncbi:hypothetical protein ASPBRDRAFT_470431 [Aspergillus brasiliensis CBS 101740]|uniref:Uncharacterized protein n=1 Tax=Aspergillus brasiliensis (strain CBS 101740 / IMI 381727 / IBT 21946) TaxID=767769 RepID=A0A1L9UTT5_ASPBC|nr:hypothetical protein ASPBRDRAFT_470431 [Aspergillus brasiliensis CBS 101740]